MGYIYFAYGLNIRSEIFLPELAEGKAPPDVNIFLGKVDPIEGEVKAQGTFFRARENEATLFLPEVGSILVREGSEIVVDPASGSDHASMRSLILDSAMAVLLHQRGLLVMHASSSALAGGAVVFLGEPGAGKSSTVAALHVREHPVLGDEVIALRVDGSGPIVYPSFPRIKLPPETARSMGCDLEVLPRVHPKEEKRSLLVREAFPKEPLPLKRIYLLEEGDGCRIDPMSPQEAFLEMVRNCYTAGLLKASGASSHLIQCGRLIEEVPLRRLTRCRDLGELPNLVKTIEDDIAQDEECGPASDNPLK